MGVSDVDDFCQDIVVDVDGNIFVAGYREQDFGESTDAFVSKFNRLGTRIWTRRIGTLSNHLDVSIAADGVGGAILVGHTEGQLGPDDSFPGQDAFVMSLDTDGRTSWSHQFGYHGVDFATALTIDRYGNSYVAGNSRSNYDGLESWVHSMFIWKFSPTGSELWKKEFGTGNSDEYISGLDIDSHGDLLIAGTTTGLLGDEHFSSSEDAFVAKMSNEGEFVWLEQFGTYQDDFGSAVVAHENGNIYVIGSVKSGRNDQDVVVTRFASSGELHWSKTYAGSARNIAMDAVSNRTGDLLITGFYYDPDFSSSSYRRSIGFINRIDADGMLLSSDRVGSYNSTAESIDVDQADGVYVTGTHFPRFGDSNGWMQKFTLVPEPQTLTVGIIGIVILAQQRKPIRSAGL